MADYQVYARLVDKKAVVQAKGDVAPDATGGAYTLIGTFSHDPNGGVSNDITLAEQGGHTHVFYHHVRDLLYKRSWKNLANTAKFPENITDMQDWSISIDTDYIALTGITITAPAGSAVTLSLAGTKTSQITTTFAPTTASNKGLTYTTSDATKATVSASGLITGVATGSATITVKSADGGFTETVAVTVTA